MSLKSIFPLPIFYLGNLVFGLSSTKMISLRLFRYSFFDIYRNLTILTNQFLIIFQIILKFFDKSGKNTKKFILFSLFSVSVNLVSIVFWLFLRSRKFVVMILIKWTKNYRFLKSKLNKYIDLKNDQK